MRIVGIIAEYNPFHNGHALQLREARARAQADCAVVVMSGCFTQRGEAAILPPAVRVQAALQNGADAVLLLPACWAVREAEHFALGGVHLLQGVGADALSFGAETADLSLLRRAAELPAEPPGLAALLAQGLPHPEALQRAWEALDPAAAAVLRAPNNLLGVSYLRAMKALGAGFDLFPVPRQGSRHDSPGTGRLASASAVRQALLNGDHRASSEALPAAELVREALLRGELVRPEALDAPLLCRLRTMSDAEYAALPGAGEGLSDRLRHAAAVTATRAALLDAAKTRRYPYARLSRMAAHALLRIDEAVLAADPLPTHAVLLGCRRNAALLARLSAGSTPLLTRRRDLPADRPWLQAEARAWDLHALAMGKESGRLYGEGVIFKE